MRGQLQRILEPAGYRVKAVNDGRTALESVVAAPPDLVLIEAHTAHMGGLEMCRRLRAHEATAHLPIIVLAPVNDNGLRLRALEGGADEALVVPVAGPELLARARNLLAQKGRRLAAAQYEQRLDTLFARTSLIHLHLDLSQVLVAFHQAIQQEFGFRRVVTLLLDPDGKTLRPATIAGTSELGEAVGTLHNAYRWDDMAHILDRRRQVSRSYFTSPQLTPDTPLPPGPWQPGETLLVPLALPEGRWLGLVSLDAPRDGQRPTLQQVHLVELFADHAAVAIHNAQLYAEQQRRVTAYVGAPVAAQLRARGTTPLQPIEAHVAVLFSDLREFTALSERLTPVATGGPGAQSLLPHDDRGDRKSWRGGG